MEPENSNETPTTKMEYLETPVHEESFKFLVTSVPKRIIGLVSKVIGVKMLLFAAATYLFVSFPEQFPWYAWLVVYTITLFGRDGLKIIKELKK